MYPNTLKIRIIYVILSIPVYFLFLSYHSITVIYMLDSFFTNNQISVLNIQNKKKKLRG